MTTCPVCGALTSVTNQTATETFVEGVMLGIVLERVARDQEFNISRLLCVEHVSKFRAMADTIPTEVVSKRHLLNFGLSTVKT